MRLFIDGEWNGYGGELLSFALIAEDFNCWYEVFPLPQSLGLGVAMNVVPQLRKEPISIPEAQRSLEKFLAQFDAIHVVADWPEDIARFCDLLVTGPGERINTPPLTLEVLRVDTVSLNPHNALADATALMTWCCK